MTHFHPSDEKMPPMPNIERTRAQLLGVINVLINKPHPMQHDMLQRALTAFGIHEQMIAQQEIACCLYNSSLELPKDSLECRTLKTTTRFVMDLLIKNVDDLGENEKYLRNTLEAFLTDHKKDQPHD